MFGISEDNDPFIYTFPTFDCGIIFAIQFYKTFTSEFNILGAVLVGITTIDGDKVAEGMLVHLIKDLEVYNIGESRDFNLILA